MSSLKFLPKNIFIPQNTFSKLIVGDRNGFNFHNKKFHLEKYPSVNINKNIYSKSFINYHGIKSGTITVTDNLVHNKPSYKIETSFETMIAFSDSNFRVNEYIKYPIVKYKNFIISDYSVIVKDLDRDETYIWNQDNCENLLQSKHIPFIVYVLYHDIKNKIKK